jgi:hypothetical protein
MTYKRTKIKESDKEFSAFAEDEEGLAAELVELDVVP